MIWQIKFYCHVELFIVFSSHGEYEIYVSQQVPLFNKIHTASL